MRFSFVRLRATRGCGGLYESRDTRERLGWRMWSERQEHENHDRGMVGLELGEEGGRVLGVLG